MLKKKPEVIERQPVEDRRNIGEFPYRRGETPIFNFDDGDEAFVQVKQSSPEFKHLFWEVMKK